MTSLATMTLLGVSSCFYTSLPDLSAPTVQPAPTTSPCPTVALPEPIPKDLNLSIAGGKVVKADEGGERLIRQYAAARKAIDKLWPSTR